MTIKLRINRLYRGVEYSIEGDLQSMQSAGQLVSLMRQAEQFIDKMLNGIERLTGEVELQQSGTKTPPVPSRCTIQPTPPTESGQITMRRQNKA